MIKLSPRVALEQYEMLRPEERREYVRVFRVCYEAALERLKKANEELAIWKEQVRLGGATKRCTGAQHQGVHPVADGSRRHDCAEVAGAQA